MQYRVRLAPHLLEAMTLAAVEAYCYSRAGRRSGDRKVRKHTFHETMGYIWGVKRYDKSRGAWIISIERMSVSISAKRYPRAVEPNSDAARLMNEVVALSSPQLSMLGDFHSQPYNTREEVLGCNGFEFSKSDFDSFLADNYVWQQAENHPLMIAVTVCRLERVRASSLEYVRNNIVRFSVGQFQIWINAAVGWRIRGADGKMQREVSGNSRSPVNLDIDNFMINETGNRLSGH